MHHKFYQGSIDKGSLDFTMTPAATPPPSSLAFSQSQLRPADRVGLWVWWFACHLILLGVLATTEIPEGDIRYYFSSLRGEFPDGLTEYPAIGTWPAHVVFWFSHRSTEHYLAMFGGFCMVIDGLFFVLLLNSGAARSRKSQILAAGFWAVFAVCTGHVSVQRLDLVPAVLVGVAALLLFYYPRISSALLGTATMIKLWPGVLAIGLVRGYKRKATYWCIAVFVGTIIGLSALVAMISGVQRLLSPFTYQGVRGLQIESIAATPMIVRGAFGAAAEYSVTYAASKSYEITGPGVDAAIMVTNVLMFATLVFAVADERVKIPAGAGLVDAAHGGARADRVPLLLRRCGTPGHGDARGHWVGNSKRVNGGVHDCVTHVGHQPPAGSQCPSQRLGGEFEIFRQPGSPTQPKNSNKWLYP